MQSALFSSKPDQTGAMSCWTEAVVAQTRIVRGPTGDRSLPNARKTGVRHCRAMIKNMTCIRWLRGSLPPKKTHLNGVAITMVGPSNDIQLKQVGEQKWWRVEEWRSGGKHEKITGCMSNAAMHCASASLFRRPPVTAFQFYMGMRQPAI